MAKSGRILTALAAMLMVRAAAPQILSDAATQIRLEGTPGAVVFVDGSRHGAIPRSGILPIGVKPGKHDLRVVMDGKRPFAQSLSVTVGQTARVQAVLAEITGSLEVFTSPGADIELNGKPAGKADQSGRLAVPNLKALAYVIRARAAGYEAGEHRVELEPDIFTSVTINLKPLEVPIERGSSVAAPAFEKHRRLAGHEDETYDIRGVSFQPTGQLLSWVGRIIQWDPESGRQLQTIDFRPAGYFLVSRDLSQISFVRHVYNPERNYTSFSNLPAARNIVEKRSWSELKPDIQGLGVAFRPDSTQLAVLVKDGVELWDVAGAKRLLTFGDPSIGNVAYSYDGRWIASGAEWGAFHEAKIVIWDSATGQKSRDFPPRSFLRRLIFSKDNRWLAAVQDEKIELWEIATGRSGPTLARPKGTGGFYDAVFTADGRYLISSNGDMLYVWDIGAGRLVGKPIEQACGDLALSPDDRWLAVVSGKSLFVLRRTP
jgi:hypothetical protein